MLNNLKRIIAVTLAIALVFSLAGCNKTKIIYEEASSGGEVEYVTQQVIVNEEGNKNNQQSGSTGNNNQQGSTSTKKDGLINDGVNPEDYRGKTIKFAATINPEVDESGPVVKAFEKKYGIKVEIVQSDQANYPNQLSGWIAAGNAPDVARSNGDFPLAMSYLQSLDAAKLDYKEEIWNQNTFKMTTFGGSPYLCDTVGNIWTEIDIVVYSKSLLKRANAYTPEEYDKQGKWTWDAFFEIARALKKTTGKASVTFTNFDNVLHGMGSPVYLLKDGKLVNGFREGNAVAAMSKFSSYYKEGLINWDSASADFLDGTSGLVTVHAWSLKKTGDLKSANYDDIGFYYLPRQSADSDYTSTGIFRGWGICRGSKEPVASGIFLREYLDVNNYDCSSTYISEDAEKFFFDVTSIDYSNYTPYLTYNSYTQEVAGMDYVKDIYVIMTYEAAQINSKMSATIDKLDKACDNLNKYIEQNTGIR